MLAQPASMVSAWNEVMAGINAKLGDMGGAVAGAGASSTASGATEPPPPTPIVAQAGAAQASRKRKAGAKPCAICELEDACGASAYCKACRKDVDACERDASRQGNKEFFDSQRKVEAKLRLMVKDYKRSAPSKGVKGRKRDDFDWVRYIEATTSRVVMRRGWKMVMMDRFEYIDFHVSKKKLTEEEIFTQWASDLQTLDDDLQDKRGPKGFEERVAVKVEEFIVGETETALSRTVERGTKPLKAGNVSNEDMAAMNRSLQETGVTFAAPAFHGISRGAGLALGDDAGRSSLRLSANTTELTSGAITGWAPGPVPHLPATPQVSSPTSNIPSGNPIQEPSSVKKNRRSTSTALASICTTRIGWTMRT